MKRARMIFMSLLTVSGLAASSACVTSALYTQRIEARHPALGQRVAFAGRSLHVLTAGETGPPVLMIHGASANAHEFTATLAPRLERDMRVLMADRPGHGYSDRLPNSDALATQAAAMAAVLEAQAPGERAVIVGHSFGGAVALRLALDRPDLVSGLVLLAPVTHDWGTSSEAWYNKLAAPPGIGHAFTQLMPLAGPAQAKAGVKDVFDPQPAPPGYYDDAALGLLFRPPHFRANARDMMALRGELAAQSVRYGEIKAPVIVFSGAADTVLKPQLHVGKLKHQIPLELVALADEGHMPHHGEGEAVAGAIRRLAKPEASR